jgi:hypothetical protein
MSITPVGGWNGPREGQIQESPPQEGQLLPKTSDTCPSCFGTDWKAASLLYAEGLSITGGQTNGGFVAVGRNGQHWQAGGGGYSGRTSGVSQTLLSAKATPPKAANVHVFFAVLFVAFLVACPFNLDGGAMVPITLAILSGGSLMLCIKTQRKEQARFERATESYASLGQKYGDMIPISCRESSFLLSWKNSVTSISCSTSNTWISPERPRGLDAAS